MASNQTLLACDWSGGVEVFLYDLRQLSSWKSQGYINVLILTCYCFYSNNPQCFTSLASRVRVEFVTMWYKWKKHHKKELDSGADFSSCHALKSLMFRKLSCFVFMQEIISELKHTLRDRFIDAPSRRWCCVLWCQMLSWHLIIFLPVL